MLNSHLTQQHGLVHADAVTTMADTACGYATLTLMPEGAAMQATMMAIADRTGSCCSSAF